MRSGWRLRISRAGCLSKYPPITMVVSRYRLGKSASICSNCGVSSKPRCGTTTTASGWRSRARRSRSAPETVRGSTPYPCSAGSGPQWMTTGLRNRADARQTASRRGSSGAIFMTCEWIFTPRKAPESASSRICSSPASPGKTVQHGRTAGRWRRATSSVNSFSARARPGLCTYGSATMWSTPPSSSTRTDSSTPARYRISQACVSNHLRIASARRSGCRWTWASTIISVRIRWDEVCRGRCCTTAMGTSTRVLAVAFVGVVAAFIGSTMLVQHQAREIDADALMISRDAAPGIQVISDLRAEVREMQARVFRTVNGFPASDIVDSRRRLDALLEHAVALPTDAPEALLLGKLHSAVRAFDEAAERALEQARGGHRDVAQETARNEVFRLADAAGAAANDLVQYDVEAAEKAAQRIEAARRRGNRTAWQLDAFCAAIAAFAAFVTVRTLRQFHRMQQANQELTERRAAELEQFAGRVAHDILSPLSAVSMAMGIVEKSPAQSAAALERAQSSLSRVRRIVDGLLEFARAGARPEAAGRADVRAVTAGLFDELSPFAVQRDAVLRFEDVPECDVACSPGVLLSVLGNLLRNGLKYLGDAELREVALRVRQRRGRVLFEVEDTGPGIPASLGARIFEPYVRGPNTGAPGIGLGLATVKRLVESHGGSLGVRAGARGGAR